MQVGDIGATITVVVSNESGPINLTGATGLSMYLRSPTGELKTFTPILFDAPGGQIRYTTAASSDLDVPGTWQVQVGFSLSGFIGRTASSVFSVDPNL